MLKKLRFSQDNMGIPHLEAVYEHWRPKGAKQNEVDFSDGTLRLIGFLWELLETNPVLLLEEPELSLHSGVVRYIPALMHRLTKAKKKKKQIIISTHSYELLSDKSIGAENVLLLIPEKESTRVELGANDKEIKTLLDKGFSVGEVVLPQTEPKNIQQLLLFDSE